MGIPSVMADARRRFAHDANVLAIGRGPSRVDGELRDDDAIIFYVRKKGAGHYDASTRIPRWLIDREADGSTSRSRRFRTDVRGVGSARATSSGQQCASSSRKGTATLAFDAGQGSARSVYALSCAHVIGDVHVRGPGFKRVKLKLPGRGFARGTRLHHVSARRGNLAYDIALAQIDERAAETPLRTVPRDDRALERFMKPPLPHNRPVEIVGHKTRAVKRGLLLGPLHTPLSIAFDGGALLVRNLYVIEGFTPKRGDSGGLVYDGGRVLGILVAKFTGGGCLFHPLHSAARYLFHQSGVDLDVDHIF